MNKKINFVYFVFLLMSGSFVLADVSYYEDDNTAFEGHASDSFYVVKLRYEPYPVSPGEYFTIWVQAERPSADAKDIRFELVEEYPFFLDSNENAVREFDSAKIEDVVLEYKVRVDESAVDGVNTLKIKQYFGTDSTIIHEFDISVSDVQTSFDAIVQETVNGETTIAIANIGQNDADAAIVRIPEQEGVRVSGTNGQMIGNLEQGDYTIVAFTFEGSGVMDLQIDYTDSIGVRRSEIVEIYRGAAMEGSSDSGTMVPGSRKAGLDSMEESGFSTTTWAILVFVFAVLGYLGYRHYKNNKLEKIKGDSSGVPTWMKKKNGAKK